MSLIRLEHLKKEYENACPLEDVCVEINKGDIIRSRTYEAFFPLIITAIIYFLLSWIITRIVEIVANKIFK